MGILVKLVNKIKYANALLDGKLFMRPAAYYRSLEEGQGDECEGRIVLDKAIYVNGEFPIYCMCSFSNHEIVNGHLLIPKQCINDFDCPKGYAVILNWEQFEERLPYLNCHGHKLVSGRVEYKISRGLGDYLDIRESENQGKFKSLFIKRPSFSHQNEYRIVVDEAMYSVFWDKDPNITYSFPMRLSDIGYIISISDCITIGDCKSL